MRMNSLPQRLVLAAVLLCSALPVSAQTAPESAFGTARVTSIVREYDDAFAGMTRRVQEVQLVIESGPAKGRTVVIENGVVGDRADMILSPGDRLVVEQIIGEDGSMEIQWRERYRLPQVLWLCLGFVLLALLLGRKTGAMSLLGLCVSIGIIAFVLVPRIAQGDDPLLVSLLCSGAIVCSSLYLAHGFTRRTTVALLSTLVTLTLSVALALLAVHLAGLFGMGSEESLYLQVGTMMTVNLRGLLLGSIVIGCLGVLDDITTAQTAVVDELKKANASMTDTALMTSAMSVGREHIASLINTLALAYAGASLPLLLLFHTQDPYPLWLILNGEAIAEELIRTLVGSATLLLAVPISTAIAVKLLPKHGTSAATHGHVH